VIAWHGCELVAADGVIDALGGRRPVVASLTAGR
jgi:hypothetical protein